MVVANDESAPADDVSWVDWAPGGGHKLYPQPRNLGSAILHSSVTETILFVLNHYPEAARFALQFGSAHRVTRLVDLDSGSAHPVRAGKVVIDIDRKTAAIYRVE